MKSGTTTSRIPETENGTGMAILVPTSAFRYFLTAARTGDLDA